MICLDLLDIPRWSCSCISQVWDTWISSQTWSPAVWSSWNWKDLNDQGAGQKPSEVFVKLAAASDSKERFRSWGLCLRHSTLTAPLWTCHLQDWRPIQSWCNWDLIAWPDYNLMFLAEQRLFWVLFRPRTYNNEQLKKMYEANSEPTAPRIFDQKYTVESIESAIRLRIKDVIFVMEDLRLRGKHWGSKTFWFNP